MSEDAESPKPVITRRKFLGGAAVAGLGLTGLAAAIGLKRGPEPQSAPERPIAVNGEIRAVVNEDLLHKQLQEKFGLDSSVKTAAFNILAHSDKGQADSSFVVAERPEDDGNNHNRVFIDNDGNLTELLPWRRGSDKTYTDIVWYIPGRDAVPGKDIGINDKALPGAIGMQPVLTAKDNTQYLQQLSYRPPAAHNAALFGQNYREDSISGAVVKADKIPEEVKRLFATRPGITITMPLLDGRPKQ